MLAKMDYSIQDQAVGQEAQLSPENPEPRFHLVLERKTTSHIKERDILRWLNFDSRRSELQLIRFVKHLKIISLCMGVQKTNIFFNCYHLVQKY
mmetsp:Transcript_2267/g.4147  ORF Transcript_2267/g.4147 Transcript_2267/m.4147 type:complete len:94 (-) Transcript_2267:54-335(-)